MFRLESYITPILLNHVAKYVKNIRPQDAQLRLWEGDVQFQNLDLRLDVLEEELNLPCEFLSGHIHELSIQVPWTKITSEPIRIVINTIEFVLKLKLPTKDGAATPVPPSPQRNNNASSKKSKKTEEATAPAQPSAVMGLVNKIINNIVVECHNIILKYVDEDIVVSMNVQLLSVTSADERWQPAMIDIHPVRVLMRKLIQVSDLTICLDKRNAAGQIDVCQEPILYRCTLEVRILRKVNTNTADTTSTMRIGIFTKSFDLNLSSSQFPMIIRVLNLATSLKSLSPKSASSVELQVEEHVEQEAANQADESYFTWIWNMLPSFSFPSLEEEEQADAELPGHMLDLGVYVEQFNFTVKSLEFLQESHIGTVKRVRYTPIIRLTVGGVYFEMVSVAERNWTSIKAGLATIHLEPMGPYRGEGNVAKSIIKTIPMEDTHPFIDKSLFDEQYQIVDKGWAVSSYEEYLTHITDEYLLYRTPVLAFDMIEYQPTRTDNDSSVDVAAGAYDKRMQCRVLSSGITVRYNQALLQVKNVLSELVDSYDYPPYHAEQSDGAATKTPGKAGGGNHSHSGTGGAGAPIAKLHPPLMEDYDALMQHIPLRTFKFMLRNISVELFPKVEPDMGITSLGQKPQRRQQLSPKQSLPCFVLGFEAASGTWTTPLEPDRLVHTTCQLPNKPQNLLDACYDNFNWQLCQLSCRLCLHDQGKNTPAATLLSIPLIDVSFGKLLQPQLWRDSDVPECKVEMHCHLITFSFNAVDLLNGQRLVNCMSNFQPMWMLGMAKQLAMHEEQRELVHLKTTLEGLQVLLRQYKAYVICNAQLHGLQSDVVQMRGSDEARYVLLNTYVAEQKDEKQWLECHAQFPMGSQQNQLAACKTPIFKGKNKIKPNDLQLATTMALWVGRYAISIDARLLEFFKHNDDSMFMDCEKAEPIMEVELNTLTLYPQTSSAAQLHLAASLSNAFVSPMQNLTLNTSNSISARRSSRQTQPSRKVSHPEETIHISSDRDDRLQKDTPHTLHSSKEEDTAVWLPFLKHLLLQVDVAGGVVNIADELQRNVLGEIVCDHTQIVLPQILLKSAHGEQLERSNMLQCICVSKKANLNWTIWLQDMAIYNRNFGSGADNVLAPIQTSITIAMTHTLILKNSKNSMPERLDQIFRKVKQKNTLGTLTEMSELKKSENLSSSSSLDSQSQVEIEVKPEDNPTTHDKRFRDAVTFNIHADTAPIRFFASTTTVRMLHNRLGVLMQVMQSMQTPSNSACSDTEQTTKSVKVLTSTEEDPKLKEFMEFETSSDTSQISEMAELPGLTVYLFCQCTIAKIIVEMKKTDFDLIGSKLILELEDLLATVDIHEEYSKFTSKLGNFSLNYYKPTNNREWESQECIRIRMLGESTSLPFFNVIITSVALKSLYRRIGAKHRGNVNRSIAEVLVKMQALEMILDLDRITEFAEPLSLLLGNNSATDETKPANVSEQTDANKPPAAPITAAQLPLIHFDSKGFVLYLPVKTMQRNCTVLLFKIESITATPNLENPLQRTPLRADVYGKAAQMGLLETPGSLIEDRQYELTLGNISIATANWERILTRMREQSHIFHKTNPAFEWNNLNQNKQLPQLVYIFNKFKFIAIFAPCIVYNNVVVCGQALEFNCAADFVATLNLHQLNMFCCMVQRLNNISAMVERICRTKSLENKQSKFELLSHSLYMIPNSNDSSNETLDTAQTPQLSAAALSVPPPAVAVRPCAMKATNIKKEQIQSSSFKSIQEDCELQHTQPAKTDSGFNSCISQSLCQRSTNSKEHFVSLSGSSSLLERAEYYQQQQQSRTSTIYRRIPHTMSLVAGAFIIEICAVDKSDENALKPLISLTISQPSFMITQNMYDSVTQISLFDLALCMPGAGDGNIQKSGDKFSVHLIDTLPGELNTTGIPPPLLSVKCHNTKVQMLEVDVEVLKSIRVQVIEEHAIRLIASIFVILDALVVPDELQAQTSAPAVNCASSSSSSLPRGTKIELIKRSCLNADRLCCKCHRIIFKFSNANDYNCQVIVADVRQNSRFLSRPEKASMKTSIGSLHVQTKNKVFLHPLAVRLSADLIAEPWHNLPLIVATAKFNIIHVDVGIYALVQLQHASQGFQRLMANLAEEQMKFVRSHRTEQVESMPPPERLHAMKCPSVNSQELLMAANGSKSKMHREEYYQDDLRAGAFQFVELTGDSFLPLPYQIQIIKKNYGIICWRYPQPRKMRKIHIFPVPMAVASPIHIKCRMEYFSEVHECFRHYCDFCLSETVSKQIPLPELEVCANIWRVVILQSFVSVNGDCFDNCDDDDDLLSIPSMNLEQVLKPDSSHDTEFILHPKVLVACMRIDTTFRSRSVPKTQLLISCNTLQVKLLNQPNENVELPQLLRKFRLAEQTAISQCFMVLLLERISFHASILTSQNFTLNNSMNCSIKCIDFGFLNMLNLLEQTVIQSYVHVDLLQREIAANIVLDRFRINFGPSIIHTLLASKAHWEELLDQHSERKRYAFIPKVIVANRTYSHVTFGQTGTVERIRLKPKECHMYSFRSGFHNQELTFYIADDESQITEVSSSVAIPLKFEGEIMLKPQRIGNKCIIIKLQKLSSSQIFVLIKGQIELISMVPHDLRVEFRSDGCPVLLAHQHTIEYNLEEKARMTFYRAVQRDTQLTMRVKFSNSKGKGRSGDIPLRTNKNLPWLVKVPTVNNQFISFWVRVLREDITELCSDSFKPQTMLITIWPIFMITTLLPYSVSAAEETNKEEFHLAAGGAAHILDVPATHMTEHKVEFNYRFPVESAEKSRYALTLKSLEWNKFFWYDEQRWTCEYAIGELGKNRPLTWPMHDPEELRVKRVSYMNGRADIQYKLVPSREFSCTLNLQVSAWGIFINAAGEPISIFDCETREQIVIDSNCMEFMLPIKRAFTLGVQDGNSWIESLPIHYIETAPPPSSRHYMLRTNYTTDIVLLRNSAVLKFVLELKYEPHGKVFRLRPKYVVTNFTRQALCLLAFAIDHKESVSKADVQGLDDETKKLRLSSVKSSEDSIGHSLDCFSDLNGGKYKRSHDTAFVYFVSIKLCDESSISIPIPLTLAFMRRCFSLQVGAESIPLIATLIEKNNVYYLSISDDDSPAILVHNHTDVQFIVAQTNAPEQAKVANTTPEYDGRHFQWYQILEPRSRCYYTPPELYNNFPDVESALCNLTLALYKEDANKKNLKWSKPLRCDKTWEKFLHVPCHGDIKVAICDKHRIIRVSISHIAQQREFSVKDLRLRLLTPNIISATNPGVAAAASSSLETIPSSTSIFTIPDVPIEDDTTEIELPEPLCEHFKQECEMKTQWQVRFFVKELILSLHTDSKSREDVKCEIFGLFIDDLMLAYTDNDISEQRQLQVFLPNLQIDNQLYSSGKHDFPVVLCSQELYQTTCHVPHVQYLERTYQELNKRGAMISLTVNLYLDEMKLESISVRINPIRSYIEDSYLNDLLEALVDCVPATCVYTPSPQVQRIELSEGQVLIPREVVAEVICIAQPLQLRTFTIEPLNVLLSVHTSVRLYIALDHSPLSFSTYERQKVLTVPLRFGQSLGMHFLSGALFGAGWVVGSLEILGSPSGLARSVSMGLRDFLEMPMQGLFTGPWEFFVGITQGSASLLRNVTAGTVNSVTKLASSVARNLDRLTLDQEHIERTEALRRSRPQGLAEGLSQGMTGLGISILGAVGGLAHHTLEARSPVEVVTGMGKGLVGLVKPISGAAELLALAGQGVLHTVGFNAMPQTRSPAVCANMTVEPSGFRIWRLLPQELLSDQILFYHEVTIVTPDQMRRAYVILTAAVFAILESQGDKLSLVVPVDKVKLATDADDKTLIYIHLVKEQDEAEEDMQYTNERIMHFLQTSKFSMAMTSDSLDDLLQTQTEQKYAQAGDWSFYINEHLAEHLLLYLGIVNKRGSRLTKLCE